MEQGDFRGSITVLDEAISRNEDLAASYKLRGQLKIMIGDFSGALADYDRAIEVKVDDGTLYERRAELKLFEKKGPSAILKDLDAAISYGRKHENVYSLRGRVRRMLGDKKGAVEDLEIAIGLRPDIAGPYLTLGGIYASDRDYDKAIELLKRYIDLYEASDPAKPGGKVLVSTSTLIPTLSNDTFVVNEYTTILSGDPTGAYRGPISREEGERLAFETTRRRNTSSAYGNLGELYRRKKDYGKATGLFEKAVKLDPSNFPLMAQRAHLRLDMNNYEGVISDIDTIAPYMSSTPDIYLRRGIAYMMLSKQTEAQKDFDRYLQLFPNGKAILDKNVAAAKEKQAAKLPQP